MSYFEQLLNDPNVIWDVVFYGEDGDKSRFINVFAKYNTAVKALEEYCEHQRFTLYETQETVFEVYDGNKKEYEVMIFSRRIE